MQLPTPRADRMCPACCTRARERGTTDICPWVAEMSEIVGHLVASPAGMRQLAQMAPCNRAHATSHAGPVSDVAVSQHPDLRVI